MAVKLENELDVLGKSWNSVVDRGVLSLQFIMNLITVFVLSLLGIIGIGWMLEGGWLAVLGFVVSLVGLAISLLFLAAGAAAINRKVLMSQDSSYDTIWRALLVYVRHNWQTLLAMFGICMAVFVVLVLLLLIPITAARTGGNFGLFIKELLYIPIILIAAAAILSLLFGTFIVPAETALHERGFRRTCIALTGTNYSRPLHCIAILAEAFVAAAVVALPIFVLLGLAESLVRLLTLVVAGVPPGDWPLEIAVFMRMVLLAAVLTLPVAYFSIIVARKYRSLVHEEEALEAEEAEEQPEQAEETKEQGPATPEPES